MPINSSCYQAIIEKLNNGVLLLDDKCRIRLWNHFMVEHSGKTEAEVLGQSIFEVFPEMAEAWFREQIAAVLKHNKTASFDWEMRPHLLQLKEISSAEGEGTGRMYQNCDLIAVSNTESESKLVCMVILDVTASALYQLRLSKTLMSLEKISRQDGLTELYNRGYWEGRLNEEFARSMRYPDSADMTLLMFDVDHFKAVNDQYGHPAGDQVLKEIAALVQDMFRNIDILGRYGGEEFAIVLPKTTLEGAEIAAERLREKVALNLFAFEQAAIKVTISIGLAQFETEMKSHQDLIAAADEALYKAKAAGRNKLKIYGQY